MQMLGSSHMLLVGVWAKFPRDLFTINFIALRDTWKASRAHFSSMKVLPEAIHMYAAANEGRHTLDASSSALWARAGLTLSCLCVWLTVWWVALLHHSSPQVRQRSHAKLTAVEWMSWNRQNRPFLSWGVFWGDFATVKERAGGSHPWRTVCTLLTKLKLKLLGDPGMLLLISGQKKWNYSIRDTPTYAITGGESHDSPQPRRATLLHDS